MKKHWYLEYNSKITAEVFKQIMRILVHFGYTRRRHANIAFTYESFQNQRFLRDNCKDEEVHIERIRTVCIDNNEQTNSFITVEDILKLSLTPEIY